MRRLSVLQEPVVLEYQMCYLLKSVGDRTPPCGTPFLNWLVLMFCFGMWCML